MTAIEETTLIREGYQLIFKSQAIEKNLEYIPSVIHNELSEEKYVLIDTYPFIPLKIDNLKKMVERLKNLNPVNFNMRMYRTAMSDNPTYTLLNEIESQIEFNECNTIGCIIGYCVQLAPELVTYEDVIEGDNKTIDFLQWSLDFTGIPFNDNFLWSYMFSGDWAYFDHTIEGAISRINHVINNTFRQDEMFHKFFQRY